MLVFGRDASFQVQLAERCDGLRHCRRARGYHIPFRFGTLDIAARRQGETRQVSLSTTRELPHS
jgi:hypothetical protein